ncbi:MAG: hypothetical protein ACI970_000936 [Myxococcota bacterium]|jgi:hypothetical protein
MNHSRPARRVVAAGALAGLISAGLAFAPALRSDSVQANIISAADLGLDFAPQLVTVTVDDAAQRTQLSGLGLDLTEHAGHDYVEVVLHTAAEAARLTAAGFRYDVRIADMIARESERGLIDAAFAKAVAVTDLPSGNNSYRVLGDFESEIDQLTDDNSAIAKRISIGSSVEGRDLIGIEIGVDVQAPEDGRPVFFMLGVHHAREWPSAELPMEFAHDLINKFNDGDARVIDLLSRGRAIIVPVSNPDGYDASRSSGELVDLNRLGSDGNVGTAVILGTPGNAYKRKNCRYLNGQTQPAGTCVLVPSQGGLGFGTDLNRNYGGLWGGPGASADNSSATYRGPAPFSEPETQAIRSLISTRQVTTLITNHTFSNLLLRPVGVNPNAISPDGNPVGFAPDECFTSADGSDDGMQALGERMSAQNGYSNQFGWELYDTTGTTEDYSYNATGGYGYTFEIGPDEFHPPFENVVNEYTGNNPAAEGVTPENASDLTTGAADSCGGTAQDHTTVGGGNGESYLLAFENAVNAATHSVISGTAPAGATLTLERSGVFPLWDGTLFGDSVGTSMVVGDDGSFDWHVNPSTRPFVASRKAPVLGPAIDSANVSGVVAPLTTGTQTFEVTEAVDLLAVTVQTTVPVDGQVVSYNQFQLSLADANGTEVATAKEFGPINSIAWTGVNGAGVEPGIYTITVSNALGSLAYELQMASKNVLSDATPRRFESWTLTCITADGIAGQVGVEVDRGAAVELGDVCS